MLLCIVWRGRCVCYLFVFKQKTAYEMRISDWSSDVCSSDLQLAEGVEIVAGRDGVEDHVEAAGVRRHLRGIARVDDLVGTQRAGAVALAFGGGEGDEIGRASCRERVCQYV